METNRKIVISGYYGFDNTGDEAVLYSIIQALYQECKACQLEITVLSNQPEKTMKAYDVKAVNRWDLKAVYKEIKACDLLISGGGSLLQDVTSNKTVPYYLLIIKMAQWHKKEVVFYSQGFGPVRASHSKFLIKRVLNKIDPLFVRDKNSKKALEKIGVTRPSIIVTADPVLGMEPKEKIVTRMKTYLESYGTENLRVGIYLRSWKNDKDLIKKMATVCDRLSKEGLDVFFIPMQQPEDVNFLKDEGFLKLPAYKLIDPLKVEEVFALTGQLDLVIGMRLHALIMASAQGIPSVGLSYDPKVADFMKTINNHDCFDVDTFKEEDLIRAVKAQVFNIKSQKENILYKRQELRKKVYEPAKLACKILN